MDRKAELDALLDGRPAAEVARARFDLTVLSVLLDAGAGARWSYTEGQDVGAAALPVQRHAGDELLALLDQAAKGPAAPPPGDAPDAAAAAVVGEAGHGRLPALGRPGRGEPACVHGRRLLGVDERPAARRCRHPQAGRSGRAARRLPGHAGECDGRPRRPRRAHQPARQRLGDRVGAGTGLPARPGLLYDRITAGGTRTAVSATEVLAAVLQLLSPIFTSGSRVQGLPAGDVWPHRWAGADTASGPDATTGGWVPFHKLGQWLAYSLLEPLQWAGVQVSGLDALTGLPEYRNGGLLVDGGVIVPRDARDLSRNWKPGDEFIVEWRALTVTLLDELADAGAPAPGPVRGRAAAGLHPRRRHLGRRTRTRRRAARRRLAAAEDRQRRHGVLIRRSDHAEGPAAASDAGDLQFSVRARRRATLPAGWRPALALTWRPCGRVPSSPAPSSRAGLAAAFFAGAAWPRLRPAALGAIACSTFTAAFWRRWRLPSPSA